MTITNDPKIDSESLFTHHFKTLKDPRRTTRGNFQYPLEEILFLVISATISGMDGWHDITMFGKTKVEWLRKFFPFANGVPSHDVLNRLFNALDPERFNVCFIKWSKSLSAKTRGKVVALDGKTVRGPASDNLPSKLHIVSAFCAGNELSLGQVRVGDKSNEITAIPELLDLITVEGCTVTIDAMGCQTKIARKIIDKRADYILMVKENQPELLEQLEKLFRIGNIEDIHTWDDMGHGRIEQRTCGVITDLRFLDGRERWKGLSTIARIESKRTDKKTGATSDQTRYYISSHKGGAQMHNQSIRAHWAIENNLHWVLDVVMNEDGQRNYKGNAPQNMNMVKKLAMVNLANDKSVKYGKKGKMKLALMDDSYREGLLKV